MARIYWNLLPKPFEAGDVIPVGNAWGFTFTAGGKRYHDPANAYPSPGIAKRAMRAFVAVEGKSGGMGILYNRLYGPDPKGFLDHCKKVLDRA